jgi:hypothetical protein
MHASPNAQRKRAAGAPSFLIAHRLMGGTMQSFDIAAKKTKARPHRKNMTIASALFSFPKFGMNGWASAKAA